VENLSFVRVAFTASREQPVTQASDRWISVQICLPVSSEGSYSSSEAADQFQTPDEILSLPLNGSPVCDVATDARDENRFAIFQRRNCRTLKDPDFAIARA